MSKKKSSRQYSPDAIKTIAGIFVCLLSLLLILSPFGRLYPLAYALGFFFGIPGYYLLGIALGLWGAYLIGLRHKVQLKWRFLLAFLLGLLGISALLSTAFKDGASDYAASFAANVRSLPISKEIGGGLIGALLYGTLDPIGAWIPYAVAGALLVFAILIIIVPILRNLPVKQPASEQAEEEEEDDSFLESSGLLEHHPEHASPVLDAPAQKPIEPSPIAMEEEEEDNPLGHFSFEPASKMPLPSRTQKYSSFHSQPSNRPVDVLAPESIPNPSPSLYEKKPVRLSGLQEAYFELDEEEPTMPEQPIAPEVPAEEEHPGFEAKKVPQDNTYSFESQAALAESVAPSFIDQETLASENVPTSGPVEVPPQQPEPEPEPVTVEEPKPAPVHNEPVADQGTPLPSFEPEPLPEVPTLDTPPTPAPAPSSAPEPEAPPAKPYELPPVSLLKTYEEQDNRQAMEEECLQKMASINKTLVDLKAGAKVVSYVIGPSTTRFDVQMDDNVPVASLARFIQDIGIRLGGVSTRFVQVVPGHSTSALEVVNSEKRTVPFKEVFLGLPQGDKYNMVIPFGEDIEGRIISADLSKFPHMLLAGTTGSGKSIFMHGIIMSLIMRNRPDQLRIALIDPKRVEMGKYKDLPHLLCPIVKEPTEAKILLRKLVDEMERRYGLLEENGVSGIREYNELMQEEGKKQMPFIVVFIDEYADLFESEKEVGEHVLRLAAKSRAAGIHLVVATQRPDVKVITGTIKSNLPVRVALSVKSFQDSRTILDAGGAEDLAGHGDMLVDCELVSKEFVRAQGCLVDNHEIRRVTEFIRNQMHVVYDQNFSDLSDPDAATSEGGYDPNASLAPTPSAAELKSASQEEKYQMIKAVIMTREYTSISQIQRDFSVGFPRAGKIFARLQAEGIVARTGDAPNSSHGSRVLKHLDDAPANPDTDALMQEQGDYSPDFEG